MQDKVMRQGTPPTAQPAAAQPPVTSWESLQTPQARKLKGYEDSTTISPCESFLLGLKSKKNLAAC